MYHFRKILTPDQTKALRGEKVPDYDPDTMVMIPSPAPGEVVWVHDLETKAPLAFITRLPEHLRSELRVACMTTEMIGVPRTGKGMGRNSAASRIFGWMPKRIMAQRESCRASVMATVHPEQHDAVVRLASYLSAELRSRYPERAAQDAATLDAEELAHEWRMADSLFTSGVINKSFQLPYHYDAQNFHTWSAMPTLRRGMEGGHLHLPEYGLVFPCADGDVTWFCGRENLHGVTPMAPRRSPGGLTRKVNMPPYRYSVVFYSLQGLKDCASHAVEEGEAAQRRSDREHRIADKIREQGK